MPVSPAACPKGNAMTERQWLNCASLRRMLDHLFPFDELSDRKLRLFICACCRQVWDLLTDERSRRAVEVGELYADDLVTEVELDHACLDAEAALDETGADRDPEADPGAWLGAWAADSELEEMVNAVAEAKQLSSRTKCHLLRDVVGNPFRQVRRVAAR